MSIHGPSNVRAGRILVLTCTLVEGNDVTITWFKDGKILKSDDKVTVQSSEGMSTLKVSRASTHDSGVYSCLGNNRVAEERVLKHVTVEGTSGGDISVNYVSVKRCFFVFIPSEISQSSWRVTSLFWRTPRYSSPFDGINSIHENTL